MSASIFTNGTILTMDAHVPFAEAIGVRDGTIVCAGALPTCRQYWARQSCGIWPERHCCPASSTGTAISPPAA